MADEARKSKESGPGTDDTTEYSASKAPETKAAAEERDPQDPKDPRLMPGGLRGTPAETGMSALDRASVPNGATRPGVTDFGQADTSSKID